MAELERLHATAPRDTILVALERDGAVIVEDLLDITIVERVNDELAPALESADPSAPLFSPLIAAFHGEQTKQVSGVPGLSPTFADDVLCNALLLSLCDAVLGPSCSRYQLNIAHLLERGPGADDQLLHRDEAVWSDVPKPAPELQLASVIAFTEFTRENGATRIVPGSHRWPDRQLTPIEQMSEAPPSEEQIAVAEMAAGSAVIYTGGTIHGGGGNTTSTGRRGAHLSYCLGWLRTEENHFLTVPPRVAAGLPRQAQELLGYAMYDGIARGGGYLGMVQTQDPVDLLARGALEA